MRSGQGKRTVLVAASIAALVIAVIVGLYLLYGAHGPDQRSRATAVALKGIGATLEEHKQRAGRYPSAEEGLRVLFPGQGSTVIDAWGRDIAYSVETKNSSRPFELYSVGENGVDERGAGDDIDYWSLTQKAEQK